MGFSYADIADRVGIRKASIHHHFPTKGDLGQALIEGFRRACGEVLRSIDGDARGPIEKLRAYSDIFAKTLADEGRMCLCGMLAAGYETLPEGMRRELVAEIADHEAWLAGVIREGIAAGLLLEVGSPREQARILFSGLEGAMLIARVMGDVDRYRAVADALIRSILIE